MFVVPALAGIRGKNRLKNWPMFVVPALAGIRAKDRLKAGLRTALIFLSLFSTQHQPISRAGLIFLLALIGFGTKAGLAPLHVWLPEAHPAAPSHVSAVMSGVMIKTGIYGLLRVLTFLGPPPPWWGWTLVGLGAISGIYGVLFALAQHDLKRLLAYHSVENIGIIVLGLGLGLLGIHYRNAPLAALAFAGSLLHVVNHAVFKSLLFLGAGSVLHATGTGEIEELGGLWKRMPVTGAAFLIGAAAICGLPPLNGFVSEWLIYAGALKGLVADLRIDARIASTLGIGALALIGGLAAACFTKAFGVVFLGEPRGPHAEHAHEAAAAMCLPMVLLAVACLTVGLCGYRVPDLLRPAIQVLTASSMPAGVPAALAAGQASMKSICLASAALLALAGLLAIGRKRLSVRPLRPAVGYLGLRLRRAHRADAVHRFLVRRADHGFLSRAGPHPENGPHSGRLLPRARLVTNRDTRSVFRKRVPAALRPGWPVGIAVSLASAGADPALRSVHRPDALGSVDLEVELMATIAAIAHVIAALALAPLLVGIIHRTKAFFAGRRGPPLAQLYYDLFKLLHKGAVYSRTTTWIFVAGPVVGLAAALVALAIVPLGGVPGLLAFPGDLVLLAYLLGLMRFVTVLAALDTGSAFEGMGASREVFSPAWPNRRSCSGWQPSPCRRRASA